MGFVLRDGRLSCAAKCRRSVEAGCAPPAWRYEKQKGIPPVKCRRVLPPPTIPTGISLWGLWVAGELGGILLAVFLFASHISRLEERNLPQQIADTWLRSSIYHRGEQNPFAFIVTATMRVFRFDFGNNVIGVVGLMLFVIGILILVRDRNSAPGAYKPSARLLGALLLLPFVINCGLAVIGRYPYGATRHNA